MKTGDIAQAAQWLAGEANPPSPIIPALRKRFDLTPKEACEAITEAGSIRSSVHDTISIATERDGEIAEEGCGR